MTVNIEGLGKITASEEVLCELVNVFYHASRSYSRENLMVSAERALKAFEGIYNELDKVGYYDATEVMK